MHIFWHYCKLRVSKFTPTTLLKFYQLKMFNLAKFKIKQTSESAIENPDSRIEVCIQNPSEKKIIDQSK